MRESHIAPAGASLPARRLQAAHSRVAGTKNAFRYTAPAERQSLAVATPFLPQQAGWLLDTASFPASPVEHAREQLLSRQELELQLTSLKLERDSAVSSTQLLRLEASHLRGEKERLHAALGTALAQQRATSARVTVLERDLASAEHMKKASIWHSFCAAKKSLLLAQDQLTERQSEAHRLLRALKQEATQHQALAQQLAALQGEKAALQAALSRALAGPAAGCPTAGLL